jgi:diguanylate cyclase (GGDEF)-like protein
MPLADLAVGEDRAAVQLALDEPAEEYGADPIRVEKRFRRRDGEQLWANLTVTAIRDDQGALLYRIAMLEDVTDRQRLQRRLRYQALHDPLTSLPNRTLLLDRLAGAFEDAPPDARIGLCYLDLDGFKMINDSLGHEIGDQLLIVVAQRIQDCACGPGELVARMGGDEFVILVERTTGTDEVITIADHVLDALAEPVRIGMHELTVSTSIGIVERPVAQAGATDLMQAADITLYGAKAEGKARWTLYDPEASDRQIARFTLTSRLPSALERREFLLEYQPLVRLSDARVLGVEALVRWRHPELGLLGPDHFVPLAEETGLIVPLGRWVLRAACQQAVLWRQRHGADAPFVSVNLAVRQLRETKLVADVRDALDETGLPAEALQLELTESAVMGTHGRPFDSLEELAAMGVRLAIDDFGTGYSNLAYLKQLPVHEIKLAGSFLAGERAAPPARPAVGHRRNPSTGPYAGPDADTRVDDEIVTALVRMAHALRLGVTAEGIETAEQAARLRDLGCDLGQGWYFARPRPAEHVVFGALPGLLSHS